MKKFVKATEINKRIKQIREQTGFTQKGFAEEIGVSRSFLSEIEAGKVKPSVETLIGVVSRFHIDASWLLTGVSWERAGESAAAESSPGYPSQTDRRRAYPVVPLLEDRVVSGPPHLLSEDDIAAYVPAWGPVIQKETYCFYLQDDAMSPIFRKGTLVGVAPISTPSKKWDGKLVALWPAKGGLTVRRFRIDQKYFIFEAENKKFPIFYLERSTRPVLFGVEWWWQSQRNVEPG